MHPIHYEMAKARIADLHRQAEQDAIAKAARQARRAKLHRPAAGLAGRVLIRLAAGSRPLVGQVCPPPSRRTR